MNVLVIGGTRFVGRLLVARLLARGDRVTVLHRGVTAHPFGDRVETLHADRRTDAFDAAIAGRTFDGVVDFAGYERADVARVLACMGERVGHYVFVSTGQVYLVRAEVPIPAREDDYDGALKPKPSGDDDEELGNWEYGVGKRSCEDAIVAATHVRSTRVRIPVVHGERDPERRLARYLDRLLEGEPVIVPDGGDRPLRHVYCTDVAQAITSMLGDRRVVGHALNFAQDETPTLMELLSKLRALVGSRSPLVPIDAARIAREGLSLREISPLSTRWMSFVDATRAKRELAFRPTPLDTYLGHIVAHELALDRPIREGVDRAARAKEIAIARSVKTDVAV
jgi:nucleoside-diphosphate-sugar epimerase